MPSVRQLEYLVALADLRHFGRAAQACNTSQPTLSQQLRALEERLGVVLVERRTSGADLTPIGREVADRARRVLVEVRDIRQLARRAGDRLVGTLRLGVTPTLGPYLLPEIVASLHRAQPDLRLYIREGIPDEQALELARGDIDLLLGPLPIEGAGLEVEPLFRERLFIVAAADHPLAGRSGLAMADLAGAAILSLDQRHHLHRQVAALCAAHGLSLLRDYEGTSLDSVRQMVGSGLGLAVLPELYLRSEVGGEAGIRVLDIADLRASRSIAAAWRGGAAYAPDYRRIAEHIQSDARSLLQLQD
ncbi:MAG: hydrogen peroxide-inducible genes activator [Allosphingosinicella sp.]|uniref:hydrogen peroxide-inducible genes activator n=1 Tax=Allosphingosinicella sp. TaxID=2823234 RepID=UPI00395DEF07